MAHARPAPLPFEDDRFEACCCSAVIEHVGAREAQAAFVRKIARVARRFVIITPNRWFLLEFHTILPLPHGLPLAGMTSNLVLTGSR